MSKTVANIINGFSKIVTFPLNNRQRMKTMGKVSEFMQREGYREVKTPRGVLKFYSLRGSGTASSVENMGKDEPETMEWIETYIKSGDTLWDIGANIGMYAMYAALDPQVKVLAFEPSALNYSLLVEHIALNKMDKNISPLCLALNNETKIATLNMRSFETGHASNSVGESKDQFGHYDTVFSQSVPAMKGQDFCTIFNQPVPDHIKLDVDGIEPYIMEGLTPLLPKVKTIIIEIEGDNLSEVSDKIETPLFSAGFEEETSCREKGHKRNRLYLNKAYTQKNNLAA